MSSAVVQLSDTARRTFYGFVARSDTLRPLLLDRRARLTLLAVSGASCSLILALRFPLLSLWFGAVILGVPHIVGGVRHAAIHRELSKGTWASVFAVFAVSVFQLSTATPLTAWTWGVLVLAMCGAVASELIFARRGRWLLLPLVALAVVISRKPLTTLMVLTHLHAYGSVIFFVLAARAKKQPWLPFSLLVLAITAAAGGGAMDALMPDAPFVPEAARDSLLSEIYGLSPSSSGVVLKRIVFLYAFGQSLHYVIWVRLMPELDRTTPVHKPFAVQLQLLRRDFGRAAMAVVAVCGGAAVLMLAGGGAAREAYFALGFFHFTLEAAALTRLALNTVPFASAPARPRG